METNKELFLEDAQELYEVLKENLLKVQKDSTDQTAIKEIFRSFHTLKGNAGFMGLAQMYQLFVKFTDMMRPIRDEKAPLTKQDIAKLQKITEVYKSVIDSFSAGKELSEAETNKFLEYVGL